MNRQPMTSYKNSTLEAQQSVAFEDAESLMKAKLKRVSSKIYF